jgi:hypothetical protein
MALDESSLAQSKLLSQIKLDLDERMRVRMEELKAHYE